MPIETKSSCLVVMMEFPKFNLQDFEKSKGAQRQKLSIQLDNICIVTDDKNIDFGAVRIKTKGSAGGHNGLKDIQEKLQTQQYTRFRFGIGGNYSKGQQIDFVLGAWSKDEQSQLIERIPVATKAIISFGTDGINNTMNMFNGK